MIQTVRMRLDNGKKYDINAMFTPRKVGWANAWGAFRSNLAAWPKGLVIPFEYQITLKGAFNWLIVFSAHTLTMLILPLLCVFGYSMRAYSIFTKDDTVKLKHYRDELKQVYEALSYIDDQEEYKKRLKEEIAKIKPY